MHTAGVDRLLAADTARNNRDLSMFRDRKSPVLLLSDLSRLQQFFLFVQQRQYGRRKQQSWVVNCGNYVSVPLYVT